MSSVTFPLSSYIFDSTHSVNVSCWVNLHMCFIYYTRQNTCKWSQSSSAVTPLLWVMPVTMAMLITDQRWHLGSFFFYSQNHSTNQGSIIWIYYRIATCITCLISHSLWIIDPSKKQDYDILILAWHCHRTVVKCKYACIDQPNLFLTLTAKLVLKVWASPFNLINQTLLI